MFAKKRHNPDTYNKLLLLSRNIFFYKDLSLKDSFETRIFLMFIHYSILLIILKQKQNKADQTDYNNLFFCIENNLRELGFGDISVNKKMKDLNKFFYDILLKINLDNSKFKLNKALAIKYFTSLNQNDEKLLKFELYFNKFYEFCFDIQPENMLKDIENYKY